MANGQLELVHGGLVSTDEATTNYADVIRNFEVAHDFLRTEFGIKPKVAWQLDPFGHSAANAELMAQMGMEAIFMGRINEEDFAERKLRQELQFVWTPEFAGQEGKAPKSEIFGHVLYTRYQPPGFVDNHFLHGGYESKKRASKDNDKWLAYFEEE